jgi:hypothetical protein
MLLLAACIPSQAKVVSISEFRDVLGAGPCHCKAQDTPCSVALASCPTGIGGSNFVLTVPATLPPCEGPTGNVKYNTKCTDLTPNYPAKNCLDLGDVPNQDCVEYNPGTCIVTPGNWTGGAFTITVGTSGFFISCQSAQGTASAWKQGSLHIVDGDPCPIGPEG